MQYYRCGLCFQVQYGVYPVQQSSAKKRQGLQYRPVPHIKNATRNICTLIIAVAPSFYNAFNITKSGCYNCYNYCTQNNCESRNFKDRKQDDKVLTAIMQKRTHKRTHKRYVLRQGATVTTDIRAQAPTGRQSNTSIHQHAPIRVPSHLWILIFAIFISISPNRCRGACAKIPTLALFQNKP